MSDKKPNPVVLLAISSVCAVCAGVIAFMAHTIIYAESGSMIAAWTGVAVVVAIFGLLIMLLLRLRKKQAAT